MKDKKFKVLIGVGTTVIAMMLLVIGYNINKSLDQEVESIGYEQVAYDECLIADIEKVLVEKGTERQNVSILLDIENISKAWQSGIYQFELVKNDELTKTETKIIPNKAESRIIAKEILSEEVLNSDNMLNYGEAILAGTEIKMVVTYSIPLSDELENYSLSLHNKPVGVGMEPTMIELK